jgi:hypothetical protein
MIREADVDGDGFINYDGACLRRDAAGWHVRMDFAVPPAASKAPRITPLPTHSSSYIFLDGVCTFLV